ncbi:CheD [Dethiosulfovibrio peptidovorans DSM 11002]|uniref:Probable chemoreceptor glutamine deamidase CheD n=1 Tax=Dethiosulfovibrio peptidovorans DSM 11002 TaxID=469381 RepID=D2Z3J4_9BACT|nr:chemotaxis protein CheD [Dethiosulfovibrio peptidovorans]EFC90300.1 CheD [Dethiosulfovibrio peptidovorans DSM 11002]
MEKGQHVGMADTVLVKHPGKLISLGLGSCIGLVLYDETAKVAAMAHIMLPESRKDKDTPKPGKFADTAVPTLIDMVLKAGAKKDRLKAKMAGGSQMFNVPGSKSGFLAVGTRNAEETEKNLKSAGIKLVGSDTGGNKGRSVEFSTDDWILVVKTLGTGKQGI